MAPTTSQAQTKRSVLVTGFGNWPGFLGKNPASAVVHTLPSSIVTQSHKLNLEVYKEPFPVVYSAVDSTVPVLLKEKQWDLVVHVGVAGPFQPGHYELETRGRRTGYWGLDADKLRPEGAMHPPFDGVEGPDLCLIQVDAEDAFARWKKHLQKAKGVDLGLSADAGLYLCEYIFYSSMAIAQLHKDELPETIIAFLHVPPETDDVAIDRGREVLQGLIKSLVESGHKARVPEEAKAKGR